MSKRRKGVEKHSMNQTPTRSRFVILPLVLLFLETSLALAEEAQQAVQGRARFELEEIVISAAPIEERIQNIPKNVTVITSDDIAQAPSNNVVDLLAREANINLQSFFGHDKDAGVDIRGFGETAVSNVVVLVDGFRLNPPDLSGPDFTSVPLEQIERIEIVRGAGSVVYGDGAVGGVINIITKKGAAKPQARLYGAYGSYDTLDGRASYSGRLKALEFNINGAYYDTDGYRENGSLEKKDAAVRLGYDVTEAIRLTAAGAYHEDEQGFPGGVPIEDIDSKDRRKETNSPDDSGETVERRVSGGIETDMGNWGLLKIKGGYRLRDNDFILGFTPLKSKDEQKSTIEEDTRSGDINYTKDYELWGLEHSFQAGLDYYRTEYISERIDQRQRNNSDVKNLGLFFTNQFYLREDLSLHFGYRYNTYEGTFRIDDLRTFGTTDVWVNGDEFDRDWTNTPYDIGLVYALNDDTSFFASYATSFRIPNVDEFAFADEELEPQEGDHVDIGVRHRIMGLAEFSLTLFQTRITDEIFFDSALNLNRNFEDKTRRRGVEVQVKFYPTESVYLWANYGYTDAKFEERDTQVPLVPKNVATVGVEWQAFEPLLVAVTGRYVGERYDGNDETNDQFEKLDAYTVFDGKLTYSHRGLKVFAGINNIFDERYATVAFSESYFPMPTRNFYGGIEWVF